MVRYMKKIKTEVSVLEKEHKLKIQEIKKNSSSDVLHTIKRIKSNETKIVALVSCIIFVVFCFLGYLIFSSIQNTGDDSNTSGPLVIEYGDNEKGMSDIINFIDNDFYTFSTKISITNNSKNDSEYEIYLEDYLDMIEYDNCNDKLLDKNLIYFSVDDSYPKSLASIYDDGCYVLFRGIIPSNKNITREVKVWYGDNSNNHYHGKINVLFVE